MRRQNGLPGQFYGGREGIYETGILDVFCFGGGVCRACVAVWTGQGESGRIRIRIQFDSAKEQEKYDKAWIARDMRNSLFVWAAVMLAGAAGSRFISGYFAVAAYVVWSVLFFREVHLDARKAFEKYLL